jgi:tetratricopeptide (TPR) repeat protein
MPSHSLRTTLACAALVLALAASPGCAWIKSLTGGERPPAVACYGPYNQAMALRAEGELPRAAAKLEEALQADPHLYPAYYHLGLVRLDMGQEELARQAWTRGVEAARQGPDRPDYDRRRAVAEMTAALAGLAQRRERRPAPAGQAPQGAGEPAAQPAAPPPSGQWAVLFSSNLEPRHAMQDRERLEKLGFSVNVRPHQLGGRTWHRVWAGCCTGREQARALKSRLAAQAGGRDLAVMRPGGGGAP